MAPDADNSGGGGTQLEDISSVGPCVKVGIMGNHLRDKGDHDAHGTEAAAMAMHRTQHIQACLTG